jgi:hypothetical protein
LPYSKPFCDRIPCRTSTLPFLEGHPR